MYGSQPTGFTPDNSGINIQDNTGSYAPYSPVFGNMNMNADQPQPMPVMPSFGVIPYLSVDQVQISFAQFAPSQQATMMPGTQQGGTVIRGTTSYQDSNGNTAMVMGYDSAGGF